MISVDSLIRQLDGVRLVADGHSQQVDLDDLSVVGITHDSRQVLPGWLFCCVQGMTTDGHDFAAAAVSAGAVALLVEREVDITEVPVLVVDSVRHAMGQAAAAVYEHPAESLHTIGVTGTSGKTSVVHLLAAIFERAGLRYRTIGTLSGIRTTPEATELQAQLKSALEDQCEVVAMEVSSHALELERVNGMKFSVAAFTNLGHDHLDFHPDMESYFQAKAKLFNAEHSELAVINIDDDHGRRLADELTAVQTPEPGTLQPVSISDAHELQTYGVASRFRWRGQEVTLQLSGRHNVINALIAAEAARGIGIDSADIADGLCAAEPPAGRMEWISAGQDFKVVVDYAHKPEALESVLLACREVVPRGRILLVVGCGGDRDAHKRPLMGQIAEEGADVVVLTSDNPRSEEPRSIIDAMIAGMTDAERVQIIEDRETAIQWAVRQATEADLVLIAGKGHETTQTIGTEVREFDDRLTAYRALESAG